MTKVSLHFVEKLTLLIALTFFPVLAQLIGAAILGYYSPEAGEEILFLAERIAFLTALLVLAYLYHQLQVINIYYTRASKVGQIGVMSLLLISAILLADRENSLLSFTWIILINILIAWQEELLYRFLIPKFLTLITNSQKYIMLIQGLLFAFLGHLDGQFLTNSFIRLPLGLLFYWIYRQSNHLILPIALHAAWNILLILL